MANKDKDITTLGGRMKSYETHDKVKVEWLESCAVIRLDGKKCSTWAKDFNKPFDEIFSNCMQDTLRYLVDKVPNCVFGETHSDEISLLIDKPHPESDVWFGGDVQKIVSVAASMASVQFNSRFKFYYDSFEPHLSMKMREVYADKVFDPLFFDCRVFTVPYDDAPNYFIWRQKDCMVNSVEAVARQYFSQSEMHGKSIPRLQCMIALKNDKWDNYPNAFKYGTFAYRIPKAIENHDGVTYRRQWTLTNTTPILTYQNCDFMGVFPM